MILMLISQTSPNLIGGISEQPPSLRSSSQCQDSQNTYNSVVSGVKKRTGTTNIAKLTLNSGSFYYSIERDNLERYILSASPAGIKVWGSDGVERTVSAPSGYSYLAGTSEYKTLTVSDTTFITNPEKVVSMNSAPVPDTTKTGLIFIRAVDYGVAYTVDLGGVVANYTAPTSGSIGVDSVASSLSSTLNANANIDAVFLGGVIKYTVLNGAPSALKTITSRGTDYITGIPGEIENFGDLPAVGFSGVVVKVNQNPTTDADDFYVKFSADGAGSWEETVKPGLASTINPATMPHTLTRNSNGSFTFQPYTWVPRLVGDEISNPNPSFIGQRISNLFFDRNRIGFLSDVNVIMTESQGLNNFWRTTVSTIVDSDPIDLSVSGTKVDVLKTSVNVKDGVLIFSESSQFLLNVGDSDVLSPETAYLTLVSDYESNTNVDPARVGDGIFFVTRRASNSGVREYVYTEGSELTESSDITGQVPTLLPNNITDMTGSSTENILLLFSSNTKTLYAYQFLQSEQRRIISSWSKWNYGGADVVYATVLGDYLYLILQRPEGVYLERMSLSPDNRLSPLKSDLCLDNIGSSSGTVRSFNAGTNQTTFTIPRDITGQVTLVSAVSIPTSSINIGGKLTPVSITQSAGVSTVRFSGDLTTLDFYYGVPYLFFYEWSIPYLKLPEGEVDIEGRYQIRNVTVLLENTGDCAFDVIYGADTEKLFNVFIADISDWSLVSDMSNLSLSQTTTDNLFTYDLDRPFPDYSTTTQYNLIDHAMRVPIMSENTGYRLIARSSGYTPVTLVKSQVEALYHKRSRTI